MEELRTTETLDLEILEDARKKAHRILKTADDTLAAQKRDWEKKKADSMDSIRNVYSDREKKITLEVFARLPLDKRRLRSQTAERILVKAIDDFLRGLSREKLLSILGLELSEKLNACEASAAGQSAGGFAKGGSAEVRYSGMSLSETRELLKKVMKDQYPDSGFHDSKFIEETHAREFPFIEINTKALKLTASVEAAAAALLKDKRAELAAALLGEGVLNA